VGARLRTVNQLRGEPPSAAGRRRVVVLVCDSLGVGAAPDAARYGDVDPHADTLGHVAAAVGGLDCPVLRRWGIGRLTHICGMPADEPPAGVVARLTPTGAGKDSTSGHWELMGAANPTPFPLYPDGFPDEVIAAFSAAIGRGVLGNEAASGTVIIEELVEEHLRTGEPIVYTSGDSVFQVAAHTDVVPLEQLYSWCETARAILTGPHRVGRVIARPFRGEPGSLERTRDRRDLATPPPGRTALDLLHEAGVEVRAIGKIEDLFAERGITSSIHTGDNRTSLDAVERALEGAGPRFVLANLVDFDQEYGHRNDPVGYARALGAFDRWLEVFADRLAEGDRVIVTADHGTDPTLLGSTDHTREFVPMVAWGPDLAEGTDLGTRGTMSDVAATVLDLFGVPDRTATPGRSFVAHLRDGAADPSTSPST
jgi:phosphopentomutase